MVRLQARPGPVGFAGEPADGSEDDVLAGHLGAHRRAAEMTDEMIVEARMSVYLHVTLEVHAAGMRKFLQTMEEAVPILEHAGWKLRGAFAQRTGRLNNIIDLWELDDFNHFDRGLATLVAHPQFASIGPALAETVQSETIVFADKAAYMHS